jgi:hypothetical protein
MIVLTNESKENFTGYSKFVSCLFKDAISMVRARGSVVVKALCYKPESCGFDSR